METKSRMCLITRIKYAQIQCYQRSPPIFKKLFGKLTHFCDVFVVVVVAVAVFCRSNIQKALFQAFHVFVFVVYVGVVAANIQNLFGK